MKKHISIIITLMVILCSIGLSGDYSYAQTKGSSTRQFGNLVFFVYLASDSTTQAADKAFYEDKDNVAEIMKEFEGSHGRSMKNYFNTISYGQFELKNVFPQYDAESGTIKPYKLDTSKNLAKKSDVDYQIISEILAKNPDLRNYTVDYDNDGLIDNLTIVIRDEKANTESSGGGVATTYPHESEYAGTAQLDTMTGKKRILHYNTISTYRLVEGIVSDGAGVLSHEFLHTLGYADLYNNGETHPVRTWSIMGSNSRYLQWPLAYERMHFSDWISIDTIDKSGEYTLDIQDNANGNQAYIIQSPLNSQEVFVVEYRRINKDDYSKEDKLDTKIGYYYSETGGIIVYRVNKTVPYLSNHGGQTGIYVFRPQNLTGLSGSASDKDATAVNKAALSVENGRTSIGSADWNAILEDGALTFADGTNSGIVISTNSSGTGEQMKFQLTMPDISGLDTWTNLNYGNPSASEASVAYWDSKLFVSSLNSGKLTTKYYANGTWSSVNPLSLSGYTYGVKLFVISNKLYVAINNDGKLSMYKLDNGNWNLISSISEVNDFDVATSGSSLFIAYADYDGNIKLGKFDGSSIDVYKNLVNGNIMCGGPKVEIVDGIPYIGYRNATDNDAINIYKYVNGSYVDVVSGSRFYGSNYDMAVADNKLYVSTVENGKLYMRKLSAGNWSCDKGSVFNTVSTELTSSQGNIYFLYSSNTGSGNTVVYQYDSKEECFVQEGTNVDVYSTNSSLINNNGDLHIAYIVNDKAYVKSKHVANDLKSITIVPPKKISYLIGESFNDNGMVVTANYTRDNKVLNKGEYSISGFDSSKEGRQSVTVSYEGVSNSFEIEIKNPVSAEHVHSWDDGTVTKSPTYTETGVKTFKCTKEGCGWTRTETIDKVEPGQPLPEPVHQHSYTRVTVPGQYLQHGYNLERCSCGDTRNYQVLEGYSTSYVKSFKLAKGKKCFTAKWKKQSKKVQKKFMGYQIRYSANPDMSGATYISVGKNKSSRKVKGLQSKATYYVQVRSFVSNGNGTFGSAWSGPKAVKVK